MLDKNIVLIPIRLAIKTTALNTIKNNMSSLMENFNLLGKTLDSLSLTLDFDFKYK